MAAYHDDDSMDVDPPSVSSTTSWADTSIFSPSPSERSCDSPQSFQQAKGKRVSRKNQAHNRGNTNFNDYLDKAVDKITAKQYRSLIPQMFQYHKHPDKELNKTKVKGLWDPGNKPTDWPQEVNFKDPNNLPKHKLWENKLVFEYLRTQILQKHPGPYVKTMALKPEPETPQMLSLSVPNPEEFQSIPCHHSPESKVPVDVTGGSTEQKGLEYCEMLSSFQVPLTVQEQGQEEEDIFTNMDVSKAASSEAAPAPSSTFNLALTTALMPDMPGPQAFVTSMIEQSDGSQIIRDYTILHNAPGETPSAILAPACSSSHDTPGYEFVTMTAEEERQAQDPKPHPETPAQVEENADQMIEAFINETYESLHKVLEKFQNLYRDCKEVIDKAKIVLKDVLTPMYKEAQSSIDDCNNLSSFSKRLEDILQRYTLLAKMKTFNFDRLSESIMGELDDLCREYPISGVIPQSFVPVVGQELTVNRVEIDVTPDLQDDWYIPSKKQRDLTLEEQFYALLPNPLKFEKVDKLGELFQVDKLGEPIKSEQEYVKMPFSPMMKDMNQLKLEDEPMQDAYLDPTTLGIQLKHCSSIEATTNDFANIESAQTRNILVLQQPSSTPMAYQPMEMSNSVTAQPAFSGQQTQTAGYSFPLTDWCVNPEEMDQYLNPQPCNKQELSAVDETLKSAQKLFNVTDSMATDRPPVFQNDTGSMANRGQLDVRPANPLTFHQVIDDVLDLEDHSSQTQEQPLTFSQLGVTLTRPVEQCSSPMWTQPSQQMIVTQASRAPPPQHYNIPVTVLEKANDLEGDNDTRPKRRRTSGKPKNGKRMA